MAGQPDAVVVLVTVPEGAAARQLADELIRGRQVACVNIVPAVDSIFWWRGEMDTARESLLVVKTRASRLEAVVEMVKRRHPYEVPEVIALPVVGGNPDYLEWLASEVESGNGDAG